MNQYQNLLKITDIQYQRLEQKLAAVVLKRKAIAQSIFETRRLIENETARISKQFISEFDASSLLSLEHWSVAQGGIIAKQFSQDADLGASQLEYMRQLKDIIVKRDEIKKRASALVIAERALKESSVDDELLALRQMQAY